MCYFLTIAVPAKHAGWITEVFGRGFQTHQTANPSVLAALPPGYAARLITSGMCSCDLYSEPGTVPTTNPAEHLRRKYAKRGWSKGKIARAIEQAAKSGSRELPQPGLRSDVADRLRELCRSAGEVAMVVHWYDGDMETSRLSLTRARPCECGELPSRTRALRVDEVLIARE